MSKIANPLEKKALPYNLSDREIQVLFLIANGKTNAEAAGMLYISPDTAKSDLKHAVEKLCVKNRTQAVYRAECIGIFAQNLLLFDKFINEF